MGNDVINHVGNATTAAGTQVVLRPCEVSFAFSLPLAVIAALRCCRAALVRFCLARDLARAPDAGCYQFATGTDARRFHWHGGT
jgi:hypothetical protein